MFAPIEPSHNAAVRYESHMEVTVSDKSHKTGTKRERLLEALKASWLTPLEAAERIGVFALSQRAGEFRREGWNVLDRWVETAGGARVKSYHIEEAR